MCLHPRARVSFVSGTMLQEQFLYRSDVPVVEIIGRRFENVEFVVRYEHLSKKSLCRLRG